MVYLLNATGADAQLLINEVCASNSSVVADSDGEYSDWIEIVNTGYEPVNLEGYGLSDNRNHLVRWIFPEYFIQPGEFLVVFASGKDIKTIPSHWKTIVAEGDTWRYIVPGSSVNGWREAGFDDSGWQTGASGIGYGDGDDATVIPPSLSVYMRKTFNIEDVSDVREAVLHMDYDDGFAAYINGSEIGRANLDGNPPAYNALASPDREAQMYSGGRPERFDISNPGSVFRNGENILAIEVHNVSGTSSDMSAIPFLSVLSQLQPGNPAPEILGLPAETFHTDFRLDADGDSLYFTDPYGSVTDSLFIRWQAIDHSFGRGDDGARYLFAEPTPGRDNDSEAFKGYTSSQLTFSRPGGRFSDPFELTITSDNPLDTIFYTTDGTVPGPGDYVYEDPLEISTDTVVKAQVIRSGYLPARPVVQSYFRNTHNGLPVVSLTTDPYNFWDYQTGIYAMGPGAEDNFPHFGANFWQDWERPVHLEMYEINDSLAFSIDAGVKIYGGWTRGHPQKSMSVFARAQYGDRNIPYRLFPGEPVDRFEAFVLRNSGNDWFGAWNESGTMFRDVLMTGLTDMMDLERQAARQAVLYINGEYWGIHNIREKINEHFLASNTGVDPDRVELLTNNQQVVIGSNAHYRQMIDYVRSNDMADEGTYAFVKQQMEVDNFIKYMVAEIYFGNTDWPGNNVKYWRPDYVNGRWRWILYDTDFGFGLWNRNKVSDNTLLHALAPSSSNNNNPPWSTLLLRKLLDNQEFKRQFINTFADHMNTSFAKERMYMRIDSLKEQIRVEMVQHAARWGGNYQSWVSRTSDLRYFASYRTANVQGQIISKFGLSGKHELTLDVAGDAQGAVKLNTLLIKDFPWTGTYFDGVPVELTAVPSPGYVFTGWSGAVVPDDPHITVDLTSAMSLTAHFEPADDPYFTRVIINEICYTPDSARSSEDWVELYNRSNQYVDLSGWKLQDNTGEHLYSIREGTVIQPDGYFVFCRDRFRFRELHTGFESFEGNLGFGFSSAGDMVRLYDSRNKLVNIVAYEPATPWPVVQEGFTLALRAPELDNYNAESWSVSDEIYGTPGRRNFGPPAGSILPVAEADDLLLGNYPNPFNRSTTITFYAGSNQHVRLSVYDLQGRLVEVLSDQSFDQGVHEISWTPQIAPGIYLLRMETPGALRTIRMLKAGN